MTYSFIPVTYPTKIFHFMLATLVKSITVPYTFMGVTKLKKLPFSLYNGDRNCCNSRPMIINYLRFDFKISLQAQAAALGWLSPETSIGAELKSSCFAGICQRLKRRLIRLIKGYYSNATFDGTYKFLSNFQLK